MSVQLIHRQPKAIRNLKFHWSCWLRRSLGKAQRYETKARKLKSYQQAESLQEVFFVPRQLSKPQPFFSAQIFISSSCLLICSLQQTNPWQFYSISDHFPRSLGMGEVLNSRFFNIKALVSSAGSQSFWAREVREVQEREQRNKERGGSCSPWEVPVQSLGLLRVMALRSPSALPREPAGSNSLPMN